MQPPPRLGDAIRDALPTYAAPESLRSWAREQARVIGAPAAPVRSNTAIRRASFAASLVAALVLGWIANSLLHSARGTTDSSSEMVASLVDMHVRSLMADHLTDVRSSDQHTVKPWFAGKIDFAPRVPDLASVGFSLLGGRVEYVAGHTAAALVYGRRGHVVNLFIWPTTAPDEAVSTATHNGYSLVHWAEHGLSYWAVSDAAAAELQAFQHAYETGK